MKLSDNYMLKEIAGNYVVIPIGQNVIDHKNMLQLNDTGAFILKQLKLQLTYDELLQIMASEYEAADEEIDTLKADLDEFLEQALSLNIIEE